ncbi:hypothetical protein FRB95_009419 [Tulasnella sp. JGI-2019a]|nr:hypothetical protein FRB95_009419 [Tulasnella sp. JGI-2019a]
MSKAVRRDAPQINDICAGLFSRGDGMSFHWAFLIPKSTTRAYKLHAEDYVPSAASYKSEEQAMTKVVGEIPPPIAVVKLGEKLNIVMYTSRLTNMPSMLPLGSLDETCTSMDSLEKICKGIPIGVTPRGEERFSCRTWFKAAMKELDDLGVVTCSDVRLLEIELTHLAMLEEASRRPTPAHFISGHSK